MKRRLFFATALFLFGCQSVPHEKPLPSPPLSKVEPAASPSKETSFTLPYAQLLQQFVDAPGHVAYREMKKNPQKLSQFVKELAQLSPSAFQSFSREEKLAFWINAYNALVLQLIVTHYPIHSSFFASLRFPRESIQQIPGAFDHPRFTVMGKKMSLDQIENDILRQKFHEPRIHMALVCAARSCPPLRQEPYQAKKLDAQLNDQAARFLQDPTRFRISTAKKRIYLSSIFKWFGGDFIPSYAPKKPTARSRKEEAILHFILLHLPPSKRPYLKDPSFSIAYLPYDWSLNEKK